MGFLIRVSLLDLLLRPQLVAVTTLLLPAVDSSWVKTSIALAANHLILIVLTSKHHQGRLNNTSSKPQHKMKCRFFLDVVVSQSTAIFELLSGEDQSLLIRRDSFFVLDLGLDIVDGVAALDLESDGLAGQGFHEDLHTSSKSQDEMEGGFFLDIVVAQGASIFQLLSSKDQTLLKLRHN